MSNDSRPSTAAPHYPRRFWFTVLCVALLNIAAWIGYDRTYAWRHRGTLRVDAFEPGEGAVVGPRPQLRWHFSADVIPPATAYGHEPGHVLPASVNGRWSWDDPRTLVFTPSTDLPRATHVSFALDEQFLRSNTGATLGRPYVSAVDAQPLALIDVHQSATESNDRYIIELHFNDRVAPGDVLQHLTLAVDDGRIVKAQLHGEAAGDVVRVITNPFPQAINPTQNASLHVRLAPGLIGLSGPLGVIAAVDRTVELTRALAAMDLKASVPARGQPNLLLSFNNEIDVVALKDVLSIDPPTQYTIESYGSESARLLGDFHPGTRYTVKLGAAPAGASDPGKYPRPGQLVAFMPDRASGVWFDNDQGYLSTAGNRAIVVHAVNVEALRVSVTRMYDNNLVAWRNVSERDRWVDTENFSRPIAERTIKLPVKKNEQQDVRLSLDELLPANAAKSDGVFRVAVEPVTKDHEEHFADSEDEPEVYERWSSGRGGSAVVTLSDIGLTAKRTRDGLVAWAVSLRTAQPLANVRVRLFSSKNQPLGEAITNTDGIARITGVHLAKDESTAILLADCVEPSPVAPLGPDLSPTTKPATATQLTWLDLRDTGSGGTHWDLADSDASGRAYLRSGYEAFVYSDRGVYRPGETVHLRAIVRGPDNAAPRTAFPLRWQFRRPDQRDWKNYTVMLNSDGAAACDVAMPPELPTGLWTVTIGLPDDAGGSGAKSFGSTAFQIEEFIPNRLKSSLAFKNAAGNRFSIGAGELHAAVQADYLFGRPAAKLPLELATHVDRVLFRPDGWSDWTFGDQAEVVTPGERTLATPKRSKRANGESSKGPGDAQLDDAGHYDWSISAGELVGVSDEIKPNEYRGPWRLTASAGVREAGGRAVTATKQIDIDALPAYVGIRRATTGAVRPGEQCEIQLAMVKPDGSAASGDAALDATLYRTSWNTVLSYRDGRYRYDSTRILDRVDSARAAITEGRGVWRVMAPSSGSYVACLRDLATGACSSLAFDATDGSPWDDNVDRENPEHIEVRVLASGETSATTRPAATAPIHIGDTVNILVASPFAGRLLLSVETDDVVHTTVLDMPASHVVVPVTITDACRPNAFASATVIRPIDPDAKWKTHRAFGVTRLAIEPTDRRLNLAIDVPKEIQPRRSLDIAVDVTDDAGNPVSNAAITLAAVDEGICSLTNFATPDPLGFFTARRALGVDSSDLYGLLMPESPRPDGTSATGGDGGGRAAARHLTPVVARRVKPVALAWVETHTDDAGVAHTSFPIPDFQGRLRVMAVGYGGNRFGSSDAPVTVRSPILAQTTWPRFAAPGDRFNVPVVLFNNTLVPEAVHVSIDTNQLLKVGQPTDVTIPARGQQQIELPVTVTDTSVGVATVHLVARGRDTEPFEESFELPIRPAAPMLQAGGYVRASTTQPAVIENVPTFLAGTESLRITATQWPTLDLPAGLDYLDRYPYGCVEQTTSTCFPLLALGEIGKAIDPQKYDPARLKLKIDAGITRLIGMQTADGGLAMWSGERTPWPWGSVYAAHFLTEARSAELDVPDDFYRHLMAYVRHLLDTGTDDAGELETQAYAAYVLALSGKIDRAILSRLTELAAASPRSDDPGDGYAMRSDARLMLACAWLRAGRRDLADGMIPQALPVPRASRQHAGNLGSPIRDRALLIQALLAVQPENPALPDLVQQLADAGLRHQWASTQDTAMAVMAIAAYLRQAQHGEPYETARLLRGEEVLSEATAGAPLAWTAPSAMEPGQFTVKIDGTAKSTAHVAWLKTGVPIKPPSDEAHGIALHRRYLSLDGHDLGGVVRSGDLVRVELTIDTSPGAEGLVIEDLLPAGLEVENARLETSAHGAAVAEQRPEEIPNFNDDRLDVRDDRVVIVGSMPGGAGKARCTYLARAVTPGAYVQPPVRAEQMYDINVNGISGGGGAFTVTSANGSNVATVRDAP
jgi:uncharacterized protein YfaS (alpha-2-macroglobulin family)